MISLGGTDLVMASLGATNLVAISLGDVDLWTAWTDTRVDKSAPQTVPQSVWTAVEWSTSTGDPIVVGGITISGAGQATITGQVMRPLGTRGTLRVTVNGTAVVTANIPQLTSATDIPATTVTLEPGDTVQLEVNLTLSQIGNRTIGTGTWMSITGA